MSPKNLAFDGSKSAGTYAPLRTRTVGYWLVGVRKVRNGGDEGEGLQSRLSGASECSLAEVT